MEFILLILKVILIVFLIVLGLILLTIGIVLFVPIRYELSGSIGDAWKLSIKGRLTYLLSIVKVSFSYEEEQFDLKLFLFGFEKKIKKEDTDEAIETVEAKEDTGIVFHEKNTSQLPEQEAGNDQEPTVIYEATVQPENTSHEERTLHEKNPSEEKKKSKVKKEKSKIDFAFWKQQLTDEHNKSVVRKIWSELCYLLKHFKFRKIVTDLVFATGDPATTGQALGILCMIPTLYRYNFKITPDFEADDAYIKGTFLVAGKVRLIHIVVTFLRLIFDKEVRLVGKRILGLLEQ